jgi:O-antigen/teichoic acid export membrane protein
MLLGTGAIQGASILNFIAFARLLEQSGFGSLRQMYLINQLVFALAFAALPTSLLYFYGKATSHGERGAVLRTHFQFAAVLSLAVILVLFLFPGAIAGALGNSELERWIPIFSAFPALYFLQYFVPAIMVAVDRSELLTRFTFSIAAINSIPPILAAYLTGSASTTLVVIVLSAVASGLISFLAITYLVRGHSVTTGSGGIAAGSVLRYVGMLTVASGLTMVGLRVDQLVVSQTFGPAIFAIYVVGAFEIPIFAILQASVSAVLLPDLAALYQRNDWDAIRRIWRNAVNRMGNITLPLAAVMVVFREEIVVLVFGETYRDAAVIFGLFALLAPIRSVAFGLLLKASGRSHYDALGAAAFLACSVVLCVTLGSLYGYVGIAVAMVMSVIGVALLLSVFVLKVTNGEIGLLTLMPASFLLKFGVLLLSAWLLRELMNLLLTIG